MLQSWLHDKQVCMRGWGHRRNQPTTSLRPKDNHRGSRDHAVNGILRRLCMPLGTSLDTALRVLLDALPDEVPVDGPSMPGSKIIGGAEFN